MLVQTESLGDTPLSLAFNKGNLEAAKQILEFLDTDTELELTLTKLLVHRNHLKQNVFHAALLHPFSDSLMQALVEYCPRINIRDVITADVHGNTPINYVAGRFKTREFANFLMRLSLPDRQQVNSAQNNAAISCRTIARRKTFDRRFYHNYVLCRDKVCNLQVEMIIVLPCIEIQSRIT